MHSFSERRSYERRSERALTRDERERSTFLGPRARAHEKKDERERKLTLIFCALYISKSMQFLPLLEIFPTYF